MSIIAFIMGPTCAGKSSFIEYATRNFPDIFGAVEVGKILRQRYSPEYFKGQNNPKHTAQEAWELCESLVEAEINDGTPVILVDGQPRDVPQVDLVMTSWGDTHREFIIVDAPLAERERRARTSRIGPDLETLAIPRLTRDMQSYYTVLVRMMEYDVRPLVVDTHRGQDPVPAFTDWLAQRAKEDHHEWGSRSICRSWPYLPGVVHADAGANSRQA